MREFFVPAAELHSAEVIWHITQIKDDPVMAEEVRRMRRMADDDYWFTMKLNQYVNIETRSGDNGNRTVTFELIAISPRQIGYIDLDWLRNSKYGSAFDSSLTFVERKNLAMGYNITRRLWYSNFTFLTFDCVLANKLPTLITNTETSK